MVHHPTTPSGSMSMASEGLPSYSSSYAPSSASSSTAYHGSQGEIDFDNLPTITVDKDGFEDIRISTPTRDLTPLRQGLGSRLLSTLSNAQPAAAALSRSGSVIHSRAKSWASLVPKLNTNNAPTTERVQYQQPNRIFGDLFNGESAPIRLGIPTSPVKEKDEIDCVMEYRPGFTERPERPNGRRRNTSQSMTPTTASKSSWFSRKASLPTPPPTNGPQDELLSMNINNSLFPHGPADPLSPHAFNDLLLNATSLLERLQLAYKEKVEYIASIQPEIDAQREEVEEAETRSRHLKMQLEDLSRQAQEQLQVNKDLTEELSQEKAKARTVRLVRRSTDNTDAGEENDDDDDTSRRRKRGSAGSASDSGFESDAETSSVLSGGMDTAAPQRLPRTPEYQVSSWAVKPQGPRERPASRQLPRSPLSTQSSGEKSMAAAGGASTWSTMEKLRGENQDLRVQMMEMQRTLQGCIDFVGTVCNP